MQTYDLSISNDDPTIQIRIPGRILRDLVARSTENGATVEHEIAVRLARSLERDFAMIEQDNEFARQAFEFITKHKTA